MSELRFQLREPFWSAWQKYGWTKGEPGFGINIDLIRKAHAEGKKIVAEYNGVAYAITPERANNFYKKASIKPTFEARGGVKLVVLPQSIFDRAEVILNEKDKKKKDQADATLSLF